MPMQKVTVRTYLYIISATPKYTTNRSLNLRLNIFQSFSENIKKNKVPVLTTILIPKRHKLCRYSNQFQCSLFEHKFQL